MWAGRQYDEWSRADGRPMVDQTIHRRGDESRQWVGPRSSIAIDRMTAIGACSSLPPILAKVSSPNDRGHSGWAAGTGLHAPKRSLRAEITRPDGKRPFR